MFGHRWLRENDYDGLIASIRSLSDKIDTMQASNDALRERLIDAEAAKRSAMTMRDGLITRVNVLEEECATYRNKLTGLPQIAPKIEKGSPMRATDLGAGVDLFEDVGDDKARELESKGLLHQADDIVPLAGAAELTKHLN